MRKFSSTPSPYRTVLQKHCSSLTTAKRILLPRQRSACMPTNSFLNQNSSRLCGRPAWSYEGALPAAMQCDENGQRRRGLREVYPKGEIISPLRSPLLVEDGWLRDQEKLRSHL